MLRWLLVFLLLPCLCGCIKMGDPYAFVYPGSKQKRARIQGRIEANLKMLKPDEREFVKQYENDIKQMETNSGVPPPDRTLRAIIDLQKEKAAKASESASDKSTASDSAIVAEMKRLVEIGIYNKQSVIQDPARITPGDQVFLTINLLNKAQHDITAIGSRVYVEDLSGTELGMIEMNINAAIKRNQPIGWQGSITLRGEQDRKLLDSDKTALKLRFEPRTLVFANGTAMASGTVPQ